MRSLYLRLLVSLWLTMTLLLGAFALIHASTFPAQTDSLRWKLNLRSIELRAESAMRCAARQSAPSPSTAPAEDCDRTLTPFEERDQRVAVYRSGSGELVLGQAIEGAAATVEKARRAGEGAVTRVGDMDVIAVPIRRDPTLDAVAIGPTRSPWVAFLVPDTLPYRLLAIVVVTGLVSVVLARYLSRPIQVLRRATQRLAGGDLSVRVTPELVASADGETLALGREMDRMAERIEGLMEAQRRLLRDVSHELRSPLARLNIALELVRRRSPPDVGDAFDRIERETERLNAMIGELLTLSRLEAEHGLKQTRPVDVADLVANIVDDVAFEAEQHGSSVVLAERAEASIDGSEELLRHAIENVLRNAVRFTEPGTEVRADVSAKDGQIEIRVRDHGPGVPASALADIWRPFYRVDDNRARGTGGTGIGLAITQRAVLLHGGDVRAENAEGGGLLVTLLLPRGGLNNRTHSRNTEGTMAPHLADRDAGSAALRGAMGGGSSQETDLRP